MVPLQDYPHARQSQTMADAVAMLQDTQIEFGGTISAPRLLLVLDDNNVLIGGLRRRDILRGLQPVFPEALESAHPEAHVGTEIDPNLTDLIPGLEAGQLAASLDQPIGDFVCELRGHVDIDDSLMKVVGELVGKDTHIAAVLDGGQVVGVVRSLDLLRAVCAPADSA